MPIYTMSIQEFAELWRVLLARVDDLYRAGELPPNYPMPAIRVVINYYPDAIEIMANDLRYDCLLAFWDNITYLEQEVRL